MSNIPGTTIDFNRAGARRSFWSRFKSHADKIYIKKRSIEITGSDGAGISRLLILLALQARCKNRSVLFLHDRWDMETRGALDLFGFGLGRKEACLVELPRYKTRNWDLDIDCYQKEINAAKAFSEHNPDALILVDKRVATDTPPTNNALASEILRNLDEAFCGQIVSAGAYCEEGPDKALILGRAPFPWIPNSLGSNWKTKERISNLDTGKFLFVSDNGLIPVVVPDMILPGHIPNAEGPYIKSAMR